MENLNSETEAEESTGALDATAIEPPADSSSSSSSSSSDSAVCAGKWFLLNFVDKLFFLKIFQECTRRLHFGSLYINANQYSYID